MLIDTVLTLLLFSTWTTVRMATQIVTCASLLVLDGKLTYS